MSAVATDLQHAVEDAAAHLYVWALKDIPQDLRDALQEAAGRETSVPGRRVLDTILRNVEVADGDGNLVCQDTGIAVYTCHVGEHFPLHPARILTVTGILTAFAMASITLAAWPGSRIRLQPALCLAIFGTGQPMFTSTMSAPIPSTMRAASAILAGSPPKI